MFSQYFGQYLLNQGLVSGDKLHQAILAQKETHVKLGVLAINQAYMTARQVEEVHQAQMTVDKRFGEIAVELGYITEVQVGELLSSQKNAHLLLGQALIDMDEFTYETFSQSLSSFKEAYSLTDDQFSSITNGNIETLVSSILLQNHLGGKQWLCDYVSLFAKNLVRFIDSNIRLEIGDGQNQSRCEWTFSQDILKDDLSKTVTIAGDENAMLHLASRYAQESIETPDEMMEASVGEFLNLHNGIFLVNLSNQGIELNLKPQVPARNIPSNSFPNTIKLNVIGTDTSFDLIISDLSDLVVHQS